MHAPAHNTDIFNSPTVTTSPTISTTPAIAIDPLTPAIPATPNSFAIEKEAQERTSCIAHTAYIKERVLLPLNP